MDYRSFHSSPPPTPIEEPQLLAHMSTTFTPRTMRVPYLIMELLKHFIRHDVRRHLLRKTGPKCGRATGMEIKVASSYDIQSLTHACHVSEKDQKMIRSHYSCRGKPAKFLNAMGSTGSGEVNTCSCLVLSYVCGLFSEIINKFNLNLTHSAWAGWTGNWRGQPKTKSKPLRSSSWFSWVSRGGTIPQSVIQSFDMSGKPQKAA